MSAYAGQRIALLTQHRKAEVIAPVLEPALHCVVETVTGFDTDRLGTFTRDIPRQGTQHEAARRKAQIGMRLTGAAIGLGSEGSFGPDPVGGLLVWNVEVLTLIDARFPVEITGIAQAPGRHGHVQTASWEALEAFARHEGFPAHHLVLHPSDAADSRIRKGIADWRTLERTFHDCRTEAANGEVFAETDLRAFANPTRMKVIGQAARDLLRRLQSLCPVCAVPGYWITGRQPGLPCAHCGEPTNAWSSETWRCLACAHEETRPAPGPERADPRHCPQCNP